MNNAIIGDALGLCIPWTMGDDMKFCIQHFKALYLLPDVAKSGLLLDAWPGGSLNNLPKLAFDLHVDMSNLRV